MKGAQSRGARHHGRRPTVKATSAVMTQKTTVKRSKLSPPSAIHAMNATLQIAGATTRTDLTAAPYLSRRPARCRHAVG